MRTNSVWAWGRIKISEKREKAAVMETLEGRAKGFASAVAWTKACSLLCLENTQGGFHWVGVSREWQIVFTDHCSYFWLLKIQALTEPSLQLYLMTILTTKSLCVCEFENILDICLFRFSYSQITEETRSNNCLLTSHDYSTLVNLKIGKNLLQTNSDEIRFHSFFANFFLPWQPKVQPIGHFTCLY